MAKSLQEQLLEAGAVKKERAVQISKAKHKQARQRARGAASPDEIKAAAQQAQAEKIGRDRALSRQRQEETAQKALAAQVRQLIETNLVDRRDGELPYNFSDGGVVKSIRLTSAQQAGLAAGHLAIARFQESYALVPAAVAARIIARDRAAIVVMNAVDEEQSGEDDPYADFPVPDDLSW